MKDEPGSGDLPSGEDAALSLLWGTLAVAPWGALYVLLFVPSANVSPSLRALHLGFEVAHVLGWGGLWCFFTWVLGRFTRQRGTTFWILSWLLLSLSLAGILEETVHRRAIVAVSNFGLPADGAFVNAMRAIQHLVAGGFLALSPLLGKTLAEFLPAGLKAWVPGTMILIGCGVAFGQHFVLTDEYEEVHLVLVMASIGMSGGGLSEGVTRFSRSWASVPTWGALLAGLLALPTENDVRLELFRKPGVAASFLSAQALWNMPRVPTISAFEPQKSARAIPAGGRARCVVLLTIDALRADVMRAENRARFPELFRLKEQGAYFSNAVTPGSQTSVSLTSLFSGRYFSELEWVRHGEGKQRRFYAVGKGTPRLAELLSAGKVQSFATLSPGFLAGEFGIARGFSTERQVSQTRHARAEETVGPILEQLRKREASPQFFFTHVMDAHEPYDRGEQKDGDAHARYLSEVEVVDGWIGRVRRALERSYPHDGVLIVSTDHGEAFGEHDTTFHSKTLYQELIHVPLFVFGRMVSAGEFSEPVGLIDVGPTVLDLFGLPIPDAQKGESLLPLTRGASFQRRYPRAAEGRQRRAYFDQKTGFKVIENLRRKTTEVYDLRSDPKESRNLFGRSREAAEATARARAFFAAIEKFPPIYKR